MRSLIICSNCGEYKPLEAKGLCKKCYDKKRDKIRKYSKFGKKRYRSKDHGYYIIYKPHYPYSNPRNGYVREHRYIMYIYLSILNNKVTYIEGFDVHHKNGNIKDNRIQNLELIIRSDHSKIHNPIIDRTNIFCNICKSTTTQKSKKKLNGKYYDHWYNDIPEGNLCVYCHDMIAYYRKKFTRKSKYKCMSIQSTTDEPITKSRTNTTATGRDTTRIDC